MQWTRGQRPERWFIQWPRAIDRQRSAAEAFRGAEVLMGAWGTAAWDNDSAADWYGDLFDATGLAKHVEDALNRNPEEDADVIRAAAFLLVQLGRVYIWPVDDLDRHLALAIQKLEAVRELEEFQEAEGFVEGIDAEIAVLRSRLQPPAPDAEPGAAADGGGV